MVDHQAYFYEPDPTDMVTKIEIYSNHVRDTSWEILGLNYNSICGLKTRHLY